jgi:hypothetical protein
MDLPTLVPIEYRGELVALVSPRRTHIISPRLLHARIGDPDLQFGRAHVRIGLDRLDLALQKAPPVGFEPTTCGLEVRCSIQLSYRGLRA